MKDIVALIVGELNRANKLYKPFNSAHEGYAVMLEEMDELFDEIRKKHPDKGRMREEAIQVGAMAIKFILSCAKPQEAKCRTCLFVVMTLNDRMAMREDPCEHCCRSSRWKSKVVDSFGA